MHIDLERAKGTVASSNLLAALGTRRRLSEAPDDPVQAFEFISSFAYGDLHTKPTQMPGEILGLLELLGKDSPRAVLELGTYLGGTLFLFSRVARTDGLLVTIDPPEAAAGEGYRRSRTHFFNGFARAIRNMRGAGRHKITQTLEKVGSLVGGQGNIDFLFIDADHRYEGARGLRALRAVRARRADHPLPRHCSRR
jgi:predicted O-methyltransferase YrrM